MTTLIPVVAVSPLRQRLIDEMDVRRFGLKHSATTSATSDGLRRS